VAASVVCVGGFGAAKAVPLRAALTEPASGLPVARALRRAAEAWVFLDPAAADGLPADATRQAAPRA
jgi:6-phosphogluconolactonase/glucosamine-6-phosphate isomerase/deaminase